MFSNNHNSINLLKVYGRKLVLIVCTLVITVFAWAKPFTLENNTANADTLHSLSFLVTAEGITDKIQGKAEEDIGTVQKNVGKVTGQAEGTLKQIQGKAKQDIGETKNRLDNAGDDLEDASESFVDSIKDFFGQ
jgi:uncharacterized protein YjbJ (UPF0337 family)